MARRRFVIHVSKRNFQELHKVATLIKLLDIRIDNLNAVRTFQVFTEQGIVGHPALIFAEDFVTLEGLRTAQTSRLQH